MIALKHDTLEALLADVEEQSTLGKETTLAERQAQADANTFPRRDEQ